MTKKILVVVDSININDSSGSKANTTLINNLASCGYDMCVCHYSRADIHLPKIRCISIKEKKHTILYFLSRTQRLMQRYLKVNLAKYLERVFGFSFTFFNDVNSIKYALNKLDVKSFDLVITLSKGGSFRPHYVVNQLPELYSKWLAYVHDPYPFSCYPVPYNWKEPGYKIKKHFFEMVSKNAKYSAFPSLQLRDWMGEYFSNFKNTGLVIPHQIINEFTKEIEGVNFLDTAKLNILHAGNLLKQRNPEGMLKGFILFLERYKEAREHVNLLLLGPASYHKKLIKKYEEKIPQLYTNLNNVPFERVYWLQKKVTANIILESDCDYSPFLPGKFPHCVVANRPILYFGSKQSETMRILGKDYEYFALANDIIGISKVFENLYCTWKDRKTELGLDRLELFDYLGKPYLTEQMSLVFKDV